MYEAVLLWKTCLHFIVAYLHANLNFGGVFSRETKKVCFSFGVRPQTPQPHSPNSRHRFRATSSRGKTGFD